MVAGWLDRDSDGVPALFDCHDQDDTQGAWLVQYHDRDGDGVGGERWEGDDCELVGSNVLVGGDCDDDDPDVIDDCDDEEPDPDDPDPNDPDDPDDPDDPSSGRNIQIFYGSRCQSVRAPQGVGLLLLVLGLVLRRRAQADPGGGPSRGRRS